MRAIKRPDRPLRIDNLRSPDQIGGAAVIDSVKAAYAARARVQPVYGSYEGVRFPQGLCEGVGMDVEMFCDQAIADFGNCRAVPFIGGFHGNIALGVEAFRAVVEVRRTDPEKAVVDRDYLGMDHHLLLGSVGGGNGRIGDPEPAVTVSLCKPSNETVAVAAHDDAFQQPVRASGRDDHHFRAVRLLQPVAEQLPYPSGREILVLDIDVATRAAQGVKRQPQCLPAGALFAGAGLGPGDRDRAIFKDRHCAVGPWPCARAF
ncbi:hypothetical protein FB008_10190 [Sinorhizobium medicae]|nr:hypothetical protein FB008_10190 [Sinorhizobium medicae]